MAKFLLKRFNDNSFSIYLSGKSVGHVTKSPDGLWVGMLTRGETKVSVTKVYDHSLAFFSLTLLLRIANLEKDHGVKVEFPNEAPTTDQYNHALNSYTIAYNNAVGQQVVRVVQRRPRRRYY